MSGPCMIDSSTLMLGATSDNKLYGEVKRSGVAGNLVQLLSDGVFANPGGGVLGSTLSDNTTSFFNDDAVRNFLAEVFTIGPNAFAWPINVLVIVSYEDAQLGLNPPVGGGFGGGAPFSYGQTVFVETLAGTVTPVAGSSDFKGVDTFLTPTDIGRAAGGCACVKAFRMEPGGYARVTSFRSIQRTDGTFNSGGYVWSPRGKSTHLLTAA